MNAALGRTLSLLLTSPRVRNARRGMATLRRRLDGSRATVHYFHQADDPYGHLMLQVLPMMAARYEVRLVMHLVPPPADDAAPDRPRLQAWSRRDAAEVAAALGLEFSDPGRAPDAAAVATAHRAFAAAFASDGPSADVLADALGISRDLWRGDSAALERWPVLSSTVTDTFLEVGARRRAKLGHYLGATLYFEGEWYWGVDRLEHLERRLQAAGLARDAQPSSIVRVPGIECRHRPAQDAQPTLRFYGSLRSPYTYLAVARVRALAQHYRARLELRYVLPMVMRGLPVPRAKRLYILRDAKREADSLGLPFGRIVDPVGRPTERGLAVLHQAIAAGAGPDFLESFMRGVWAEGLDAGRDRDLRRMAARAGLADDLVTAALGDDSWRAVAQANREEMLSLGLWGVPSFRVDELRARWGQDRLWLVERDLIAATGATP